ncbi:expressed unknown protein [Seminavis robusta]|uniref:Ionotropic glutamate receptor C-terminal domain-containing protein n=1 Tax=Seminavis robusta TaxID=568900 RepID=A0A9N8H3J3_9STRA|nr:expressed unknown protein [Seminavis robusta]|eukprot:Sro62_g035340.1 n/a (718) ;mRNA; f:53433-55586
MLFRIQSMRVLRLMALLELLLLLLQVDLVAAAGEMAKFTEPQMSPGVYHRQDMCEQFHLQRNGTIELQDALSGKELNVLVAPDYFHYDEETGIANYPGLAAVILDELAERAGFTWRHSFAASHAPTGANESWTDLLLWGIEAYDLNADWWAQNLDRMNQGAVFHEDWYDGSIILITKTVPEVISDEIVWTNWMLPYEPSVWALTVFTIVLSGIVYQIIEWLADDRGNRSLWEWWQENCYLSFINFTQAYEYHPKNLAGRIFGISMALWALVMTATYTANLASLYVDRKPQVVQVDTVEQAAVFGFKICTWENTNTDLYVKENYPSAYRIPKKTIEEVYDGLNRGECQYALETVTNWELSRRIRSFNPTCELEWVGEPLYRIKEVKAGFASKADSGNLCTNLVRDVLNLHMEAMKNDGFIDDAWEEDRRRKQSINCDVYDPELEAAAAVLSTTVLSESEAPPDEESPLTRRRLRRESATHERQLQLQRYLKAAGKGAVGGAVASHGDATEESQQLTMNQMIGSFMFHWVTMVFSLAIAFWNMYYNKHVKKPAKRLVRAATMRNLNTGRRLSPGRLSSDQETKDCSERESTEEGREDTSVCAFTNRADVATAATSSTRTSSGSANTSTSGRVVDKGAYDALSQEVTAMRRSQMLMEDYQRQLLEEQRIMQRQIQTLLSNLQPSSLSERPSRIPTVSTISAATGMLSGRDNGTVELYLPE